MDILRRLQNHDAGIDFSDTLREETSWNPGLLYDFKLSPTPSVPTAITAMTVDGAMGLLALGTFTGKIHLFGAAPMATTLLVPAADEHAAREEVKFLGFCASLRRLVCIDGANVLHVWDLVDLKAEEPTPPHLLKDSSFAIPENVTGEIMTFDVERLCPSPYIIPNAWLEHQEVLNRTSEAIEHRVPTVMDIVPHPRDLNLVFIAYDGGVILWNLSTSQVVHNYQLSLHPGAVGGGGYREEDLFTERYPPATSLSIHPSGQIISIGHLDGCISFWAVEDDDRPLAVRTLSEPFSFIDVNVPDPMALIDDAKDEDASSMSPPVRKQQREPIFKLAWSGFPDYPPAKDSQYGAFTSTTLTILGGTTASDQQGVTVLNFPGLVLPTPDVTTGPMSPSASAALPPSTRQALKKSLFPPESLDSATEPRSVYPSKIQVEDFCLVPRGNPHLNGLYDPTSIIILCSDTKAPKSVLNAFEFPPEPRDSSNMPAIDIYRNPLRRSQLPPMLNFTYSPPTRGISDCQIMVFQERDVFGRLVSGFVNGQN
ncbi:hypothetical protein FRC00_010344, partial [Tulasnella sp. 408]